MRTQTPMKYEHAEISYKDFLKQTLRWDREDGLSPLRAIYLRFESDVRYAEHWIPDYEKRIQEIMQMWPERKTKRFDTAGMFEDPTDVLLRIVAGLGEQECVAEKDFREAVKILWEAKARGEEFDREKDYLALTEEEIELCHREIEADSKDELHYKYGARKILTCSDEERKVVYIKKPEEKVKIFIPDGFGEEGGSILWTEKKILTNE